MKKIWLLLLLDGFMIAITAQSTVLKTAATSVTRTTESFSNSQQTSTQEPHQNTPSIKPNFLLASGRGQQSAPKGTENNELEGTRAEISAQIVHAVNLHSLHFNNICKNFTH